MRQRSRAGVRRNAPSLSHAGGGVPPRTRWWKGPGILPSVVAAAMVAVCAPLSALAGPAPHGAPPAPRVAPGLAKQAAAQPNATFQVIVQGAPGTSSDGVTAAVGKVRADRHDASGPAVHQKFTAISGVAATLTGGDIQALANDPNVTITPDLPVASTGRGPAPKGASTASSYSNDQIWPQDAGLSQLWPQLGNAQLPTIAIVDSGVDPGPISSQLLAQVDLYSGTGQNSKFDGYGHGSMVAGIAALGLAHHAGAAPGANIVSLDVLDDQGTGTESDAIAAADWILQHKDAYNIKVANFSLSTGQGTSVLYDPLDAAVEKLWLAGVTVVAAAGNYGTSSGPSGVVTAPANDPFAITVGAADTNNTADPSDDFAAPWSAYGYTPDGFAKPDLGAPGRMMNAPVPGSSTLSQQFPSRHTSLGYMWMSGTSFAAPVVSGAADDLLALHPSWTPDQVKGALMVSAHQYAGASGFPLGVGIVNGAAAAAVVNPPNPNAALDQFTTVDPATGLQVFDAASWASNAAADASWASASWASASWASASWASASWASASWASASWASASWASSTDAAASWASASWASAVNAAGTPDG